jgi:hypothetical protein
MTDDMYGRTRHLGLPLYTDDTPMDLRDGYNEAMRALDQEIHHMETIIREAKGQDK